MFAVSTYQMASVEGLTTSGEVVRIAHRPDGYERLWWMRDPDHFARLADDLLSEEYIDVLDYNDEFLSNLSIDDAATASQVMEMLGENAEQREDEDRSIWLRLPPDEGVRLGMSLHRLDRVTIRRWRVQFDPNTDRLRLVADGDPIVAVVDAPPAPTNDLTDVGS